jgi:hypothetical protein
VAAFTCANRPFTCRPGSRWSGIRSKALTLLRLPSFLFAINQAWCILPALAMDLLSWLRLLALDERLARTEPATIRTDLPGVPACLAGHARCRELKRNRCSSCEGAKYMA